MEFPGAAAFVIPSSHDVIVAEKVVRDLLGRSAVSRVSESGARIRGQDFAKQDLLNYQFTNCEFEKCDFSDVAANGVTWVGNRFVDCRFARADVEFADFSHSKFVGTLTSGHADDCATANIVGAGFNGVVLRGALFQGMASRASSFAYADFTGAEIAACGLNGTFEGCLFRDATIEDTSFLGSNISYADFSGARFGNVSVGLMELAHLFGVNIASVGNGLRVVANNPDSGSETVLDRDRLEELGRHLVVEHRSSQRYFAAANFAHMLGWSEDLMPLFVAGIRDALLRVDYRTMKLLCRLVRHVEDRRHLFGATLLRQLYELITASVAGREQNIRNQYELHDGQIRADLLNTRTNVLELQFQSVAQNAQDACKVQEQVLVSLDKVCRTAGMELRILGSQFSFNSNPTHNITVMGDVNIQQQISYNIGQPPGAIHGPQPAQRAPSAWLTFGVASLSMIFTGFNALRPLFEAKHLAPPATLVQQVIMDCHQEISGVIVPESFILKRDGMPLTGWEGGRVTLTNPAAISCAPQLGEAIR